jgi:hypothetical protein
MTASIRPPFRQPKFLQIHVKSEQVYMEILQNLYSDVVVAVGGAPAVELELGGAAAMGGLVEKMTGDT